MVPKSLRLWFVIHFIVDVIAAVPLLLIPVTILGYFGWENIDPITTRLFGAALFGIGIESYLARDSGIEIYFSMLNLKIIWSTFAILGLLLSIIEGIESSNVFLWAVLIIFVFFNIVWIYWKLRLKKQE